MKLVKTEKQRYTTLGVKEIEGSIYINERRHNVRYLDATGEFWPGFMRKYLGQPTKVNSSNHDRWIVDKSTADMIERVANIEVASI